MMNRSEHLEWCKRRALEYLEQGDLANAVTSMLSDMNKHPETVMNNSFLGMLALRHVTDRDAEGVRRFIEGFN